jgi:uncharacterized protein (DUF1330 family)
MTLLERQFVPGNPSDTMTHPPFFEEAAIPKVGSGGNGLGMAAYVISDVEMLDLSLFAKYRSIAPGTIAKYGGRYLVRGGEIQSIEGDWKPKQIVVVEFASMQKVLEWYHSPEYGEALKVREKALTRRLIFVEGIS